MTARKAKAPKTTPHRLDDEDQFAATLMRLAADPTVGADKLEKLFELHARTIADRARRAYDAALHDMQPHLPIIQERGKGEKGNSYARFEDMIEEVRPILHDYGFAISHRVAGARDHVAVTCVVSHAAGHREETTITLGLDTSDGKNPAQAAASSASYGKRITSLSILGIVTRGEDKDGHQPDNQEIETITKEQAAAVTRLMLESGTTIDQLREQFKVEDVTCIVAKAFKPICATLRAKAKLRADLKASVEASP